MKMQTQGDETRAIVDWQLPGKADPFFGSGTTPVEKALVWMGVIPFAGVYGYWLSGNNPQPDWSWWQWALVLGFVPVLFLKIVYGHAVREEPYAPPGLRT